MTEVPAVYLPEPAGIVIARFADRGRTRLLVVVRPEARGIGSSVWLARTGVKEFRGFVKLHFINQSVYFLLNFWLEFRFSHIN